MSELMDFLLENPVDGITEEIIVSTRLAKFPFTISAMTGENFSEYQKAATVIGQVGQRKGKKVDFNSKKFNELVVLNHTLTPNFRDAEAIRKAGVLSPEAFMYKVLLAGEIAELASKISTLSGFDSDVEETIEEAKNS